MRWSVLYLTVSPCDGGRETHLFRGLLLLLFLLLLCGVWCGLWSVGYSCCAAQAGSTLFVVGGADRSGVAVNDVYTLDTRV